MLRVATPLSLATALAAGAFFASLSPVDAAGWEGRSFGEFQRYQHRRGPRCMPRLAMEKAKGHGLTKAEVADIGRHKVVVEGHGRYGWGRMVFANLPGCPLIYS